MQPIIFSDKEIAIYTNSKEKKLFEEIDYNWLQDFFTFQMEIGERKSLIWRSFLFMRGHLSWLQKLQCEHFHMGNLKSKPIQVMHLVGIFMTSIWKVSRISLFASGLFGRGANKHQFGYNNNFGEEIRGKKYHTHSTNRYSI